MMLSISLAALLVAAAPPPDSGAVAKAEDVIPLVGEEVVAIVHIDVDRIDPPALARRLLGRAAEQPDAQNAVRMAGSVIGALRKTGAKDLYILLDPTELPGIPTVVVPVAEGTDAAALAVLVSGDPFQPVLRGAAIATIRRAVVAARPDVLARLKNAAPAPRAGLAGALAAGKDAVVQLVVIPSTVQRRALEESMPTLPPQLGGGPITALTQGLRWASVTFAPEPRAALHAVVQNRDDDAANVIQRLLSAARDEFAKEARKDTQLNELAKAVDQIHADVKGDRVIVNVALETAARLIAVPIQQTRETARRAQCASNLRQIALAMHNYHSAHNAFPAAYNASKDGKPLLSWRVHILPFLDQEALYKQFHLDEPWDSPHNRKLIARMPVVYACPSGNPTFARDGKTTYLTPRGPATMFPGAEPVAIKQITDGTSNTIMAVDANDDSAVIWTRPDDWAVGDEPRLHGILGHHPRGTNFVYADGSIHFLKDSVAPKLLQDLVTRNGLEVISEDSF